MTKKQRRYYHKLTKIVPSEIVPSLLIESEPEVAMPVAPAWRFTASVAVEVGALLLLPLVAFFAMRFVPINQNGFLDPYIYTGYIHEFRDLIARYGLTYYSVRFGMIVPAQGLAQIFGPEGGYFIFRYILALVAGMPLYYLVKRNFSQPVAILTVAGMLTSPYFARALLWDHPDAAGVPFLTAAICLVLLGEKLSLTRDALAGCCAAMAVNSNFFEIALIGLFGAVWLSLSLFFRRPLKELLKRTAGAALGASVICVLGCLYYWYAFGRPVNILYPTLMIASTLVNGGARQWRVEGITWIANQIHVLIPVLLGVCCLLVTPWRRVTFTGLLAVTFGVAVTAFYYVEQFLLGSDVLQLFYYFSYLMPAVFLMLAFLWQKLWERTSLGAAPFVGIGLAALVIPLMVSTWVGWTLPSMTVAPWLILGGVAVVVVLLGNRASRWPLIQGTLPWIALVLLGGWFAAGLTDYSTVLRKAGPAKNLEMDVYRVALQFMDAVPKVVERPGLVRFWYSNRPNNSINSIQSTYLWGNSKINASSPEDFGLPYVGELQIRLLSDPQVRYLALLCESETELSQGLAALRQQAIDFKIADYHVLESGDYRIYFQLVELMHGSR